MGSRIGTLGREGVVSSEATAAEVVESSAWIWLGNFDVHDLRRHESISLEAYLIGLDLSPLEEGNFHIQHRGCDCIFEPAVENLNWTSFL
jgi:hypothetical protein